MEIKHKQFRVVLGGIGCVLYTPTSSQSLSSEKGWVGIACGIEEYYKWVISNVKWIFFLGFFIILSFLWGFFIVFYVFFLFLIIIIIFVSRGKAQTMKCFLFFGPGMKTVQPVKSAGKYFSLFSKRCLRFSLFVGFLLLLLLSPLSFGVILEGPCLEGFE
jgi:hypothetical protein